MESGNCLTRRLPLLTALLLAPVLLAQTNVLSVGPVPKVTGKRSGTLAVKVPVQLQEGYHVNSNTPNEEYLIPLRLTWEKGVFPVIEVAYPKPHMEKYDFSEKPLSVFTAGFEILSTFRVPATAPTGLGMIAGKLRYQACSKTACLPPKTADVGVSVLIQ